MAPASRGFFYWPANLLAWRCGSQLEVNDIHGNSTEMALVK